MVSKKEIRHLARDYDRRAIRLRLSDGDRVLANAQADIWVQAAQALRELVRAPQGRA